MNKILISFLFFIILVSPAFANNLTIGNVSIEDRNASANTMVVQFNISWDHSWRKPDGRHDAAWVFVKLYQNSTAPWIHGKLYTAGTNPTGTSPGTNSDLKIVVPSDKIGAFISRTATGSGTFSSQKVRLVVDYGSSGIADTDTITAKVFGIEMVYVPEGPFYIGGETHELNEAIGAAYANSDGFISNFNSAQTFQWSKRMGGVNYDYGYGLKVDRSNNIIVTGLVDESTNADLNGDGDTADSGETGGGIYANNDGFISVFNSAGTFQWAKHLGGTNSDESRGVAVDSSNNVIVAGQVRDNADLNGDGDTADTNETSGGVYAFGDVAISVFNSAGTFQWSKRLGGTATDIGYAVAVASNDNIIVGGYVWSSVDLNGDADTADSNETGETAVYSTSDPFISVFNSAGTFQWSKRLGGTSTDDGYGVAVDSSNNIIVTGDVTGKSDLNGDGDTADSNETGGGVYANSDAFISVFNSAGTFQWSKRLGGTRSDYGYAVATDSSNNIIVVGTVDRNGDLNGDADTADSNETGNTGVYASTDGFISVFNSAGTFQWSKRLGGTASDDIRGVAVDSSNNVIVSGPVTGNVDLNGDGDTADANETGGGVYGVSDAFISVFNSAGTFQWSKRLGGTLGAESGNGVAVDSSNTVIIVGSVQGNADLNGDAEVTTTFAFYKSGYEDTPVQITTTATSISADTNANDDIDTSPIAVTGLAGIAGNTSWPNGYGAFYLMKYELTQGQYVDFLNTLSRVQQGNRVISTVSGNTIANYYVMSNGTSVSYRNGIRAPASGNGTSPTPIVFGNDYNANGTFNETDDGQNIAMNWCAEKNLAAYADWVGLRPFTELEFEKAGRGPNSAVYGEYAWGTTTLTQAQGPGLNLGRGSELASTSGPGLANYNGSGTDMDGALRVGFAATNATNRINAGAGYYGNMELSGNIWELMVTLGTTQGRLFAGTHGDGTLTTTASYEGNATNNDWPGIDATSARGVTGTTGFGSRGGSLFNVSAESMLSDRFYGSWPQGSNGDTGGRLARTAP